MDASASNNLGPAVVAVAWTFACLAILVVGARLYVRLRIVRSLTIDDCIILFTLVGLPCSSPFRPLRRPIGRGQWIRV